MVTPAPDPLVLALCGAAGALTYAVPVYLKAVSTDPPGRFARVMLAFAVFVGAIAAAIFTRVIGHHWPWTVSPEPWPLAMVIGLASNPLAPILLRRLEGWAETFNGGKR